MATPIDGVAAFVETSAEIWPVLEMVALRPTFTATPFLAAEIKPLLVIAASLAVRMPVEPSPLAETWLLLVSDRLVAEIAVLPSPVDKMAPPLLIAAGPSTAMAPVRPVTVPLLERLKGPML